MNKRPVAKNISNASFPLTLVRTPYKQAHTQIIINFVISYLQEQLKSTDILNMLCIYIYHPTRETI